MPLALFSNSSEVDLLFNDLKLVDEINKELNDKLPFIYNSSMYGGYLNMPSARMSPSGMVGLGACRLPPYNIWSAYMQPFDRLELSINYRVFVGVQEFHMGADGFGDDADRGINFKLKLLDRRDGYDFLPEISVGGEDFYGSKRFESYYLVATKQWLKWNLETTLGWGRKRLRGFFGAIAWSPLRHFRAPLDGFTFLAEYDSTNYTTHDAEHPQGRAVKSRVNVGLSWSIFDFAQFKVFSQRGQEVAFQGTVTYNLGRTKGFFPKVDDPKPYKAPRDFEALGHLRTEKDFAQQLAYAFAEQSMTLYKAVLTENRENLYLKILNVRYRNESDIRTRLQDILSAIVPENVPTVTVVVEADGVNVQEYFFRTDNLRAYLHQKMGEPELEVLAPLRDAQKPPNKYNSVKLYHRYKDPWQLTFGPRTMTFFGSAKGKIKYSLMMMADAQGYIADEVYYEILLSYVIRSSLDGIKDYDRYNPSQLINVRTDLIRYFQTNSVHLEMGFFQKGWNLTNGWFARLAAGYFEAMYGGVAGEFLYYPVYSPWAIGFSAAGVLKRSYNGLGFTTRIRKLDGFTPVYEHYIGSQYFLNLYYDFKPVNLDFEVNIGQFLAKDLGARAQISRYYPSGMQLFFWYTMTNKKDYVNGKRYYDRGIGITFPLDIFLTKSSRTMLGYAMAFWLRDVGAISATGKPLYRTVNRERLMVNKQRMMY